jgi:ABC-2 type transport system permease protein
MMRAIRHTVRLYALQAWYSYRALFAWNTPFSYLSIKFGFPFFAMLLFVFMGKYVGLKDPIYIVVGNLLLMPTNNGILGVAMTVANEKAFGALSYLLGSPAPRVPLFLGRSFFHILDGFTTVLGGFPIAVLVFHLDVSRMNIPLAIFCAFLISVTTCGLGFLLGSISLVNRDGGEIAGNLELAFYLLVGVNFPVAIMPIPLQWVAYALPVTRGLMAARQALQGADWNAVSSLVYGELLVGIIYGLLGYLFFRVFERRSLVNGALDNV